MEKCFQYQLELIDRLMKIVLSEDQQTHIGDILEFEDIILITCQSIWHLKDWILNDKNFGAKSKEELSRDIHENNILLICSDLANGSKHLILNKPKIGKTGAHLSEITGIYVSKETFKILFYVDCDDPANEFHGCEIRDLLSTARKAWDIIIDKHYLTNY